MVTVGELIQVLKQYDSNEEIYVSENTHDYWRNVVVHKVEGVWQTQVKYSSYHEAFKLTDDDSDDSKTVLVIE
jgi:hypothetical protein